MKGRFSWLLLLLGTGLAGACLPAAAPPPLVERIPYRVVLHYGSDIPNPYYVLSGPFQSYARFAFNEQFQRRLEAYARAKSDPQASRTIDLRVQATGLQTTYDRLGALQGSMPRLAGVGWPGDWPLSAFDSRAQDRFDDLPEQITKTATLQLRIDIDSAGTNLLSQTLASRVVQNLQRHDMGLGTYDYQPLISGVQEQALIEIDDLLQRSLPAP